MTKLESLRKQQGLTLEHVAGKVGTTAGNLSRIEKGAQLPRRKLALNLRKFFRNKISLDDIYSESA